MLDGIPAGAQEGVDARHAMGVGGHLASHHVRGADNGVQLFLEELLLDACAGGGQHPAGGGDLDDVRAFLHQLAHGAGAIIRPVARIGAAIGAHHLDAPAIDVGMAARGGHGAAGDAHARTGEFARLHAGAQGAHGFHIAAHILHGGEARHQRPAAVENAVNGVVRAAVGKGRQTASRALLAGDVHMGVDEARHHPGARQIDDLGAVRRDIAVLDGFDLVAPDQNGHLVADALLAGRGDQMAGMNDGKRFSLLRQSGGGPDGGERAKRGDSADHVSLPFALQSLTAKVSGSGASVKPQTTSNATATMQNARREGRAFR